jgi:hypothetical protein
LRRIAIIAAIAFLASSPALGAAADWREYVFAEDGFAIQFPSEPVMETARYETTITDARPAKIYSAEFDNILFKATVVDLAGITEHGSNFVGEGAYDLMRLGEVIFTDFPRVGTRGQGTFGIGMVVDAEDGSRFRSSFFYSRGNFYRIDAIVLPERGDKDQSIPSRFDQTVRFDVE